MNTYAQKINSLYEVADSNFVTLQERLEKALAKAPFFRNQLEIQMEFFWLPIHLTFFEQTFFSALYPIYITCCRKNSQLFFIAFKLF